MKLINSKVVRFTRLVEASGRPQIVSLWRAPAKDKELMAAVRNHRILTVKQPGNSKEFGVVGFHPEKDASYLKFPKPLTGFDNHRVIGINYDLVQDSVRLEAGLGLRAPGADNRIKLRRAESHVPKVRSAQDKTFQVRILYTASVELEEYVIAASKNLARKAALEKSPSLDFSKAKTVRKIVLLKETKKARPKPRLRILERGN